jgi:hypothetical protein
MPLEPTAQNSAHPSMVLCVHIEPLVRGRRVAILGDATIDLPELLSDRGARLVHAYDPDPARAAEALARAAKNRSPQGPHVSYAAFEGDLGVRDGAFDVVVIPDLSLFTDPADLLRRARRLVPTSGAVVVASPNPETKARLVGSSAAAAAPPNPAAAPPTSPKEPAALGYYELFDVVSLQFPVVRMIGQAPFVGYTIADFAQGGEPSVNVDTSLLEATEQPEWFIAVGSERPVALDEFSVIQIPLSDLRSSSIAARGDAALDSEDRLALIEARARLALMTAELEELRERGRVEARDVEAREKSTAAMSARIVELSAELEARDARLKESQSRAGDAHVRAERLVHQIGDLEEELRRQRDRATKLTKQLDDEKRARTKADMELAMIRNKPELAGARDRLQELSAELEAARSRIADLEMEQLSTVRGRASSAMPPATTPPAVTIPAAPDPELVARVSELEIALQDARHRAAEAASSRALVERRAEELEAALEAERRAGSDLRAQAQSLESERAALKAKSAELTRRAADLEQRAAHLEKQVADLARQNAELTTRSEALERRVAEVLRLQDEAAAAVIPDLASTEEVLRERGRLIASLQRDLRESERIGRELVEELEALRQGLADPESPPAPRAPASSAEGRELIDDLRARLDTLAARGAKSEADLQAASWRIAQLERELAEAHAASADPSAAAIHGLSAARE